MNKKNGKPLYFSAVQIEKRFNIFRTALAACVAILFCFFLILLSSKAPGKDIITFLTAPLSSFNRFCNPTHQALPAALYQLRYLHPVCSGYP